MSDKKKRLFFLHEDVDAFVPFEPEYFEEYLEGYDGDIFDVKFMIKYMTDDEFENIPEAQ